MQKIANGLGVQLPEIIGEADVGVTRQDLQGTVADVALTLNRAVQALAQWDSEHPENAKEKT